MQVGIAEKRTRSADDAVELKAAVGLSYFGGLCRKSSGRTPLCTYGETMVIHLGDKVPLLVPAAEDSNLLPEAILAQLLSSLRERQAY